MPQYPINEANNGIVKADGTVTVKLGPEVGVTWELTNAAIRISGAILIPQCRLYMGPAATDDNLVDATYSGAQNASSLVSAYPLTKGKYIFAVWSGADVGATATLSIFGQAITGDGRT